MNSALLLSRAVGRVTIYVDSEGRLIKTNKQTKRGFSDKPADNSFPSSNQVGRGCEKCLICLLCGIIMVAVGLYNDGGLFL